MELDDRAHRLPAAARLVPARAADLGDRHVDRSCRTSSRSSRGRATSRCRRCSRRLSSLFGGDGYHGHAVNTARSSSWSSPPCCWPASGGWCRRPRSAARSAPASRTARWRRCSASTSTAPSRSPSSSARRSPPSPALMYLMYYGVVDFSDGFLPGVKAFTAAVLGGIGSLPGAVLGGLLIGLIESVVVGLFLDRLQGRRRVLDPRHHPDLPAAGHARPSRSREGVTMTGASAPVTARGRARRRSRASKTRPPPALRRFGAVHADHRAARRRRHRRRAVTRSRGRGRSAILVFLASSSAASRRADCRLRRQTRSAPSSATEAIGWRAALATRLPACRPRRAVPLSRCSLLLILGSGRSLKWVDSYGIQILIYVMLGWGLNIVVGLAGLLDLGYVAFYAVGAYSYALLAHDLRPVVLDLPAARRHSRRAVGRHARLPGAAPARRLSRHRHPRLRRDHPHHSGQLGRLHRRRRRHRLDSRRSPSSACASPTRRTASTSSSTSITRRCTARCSSTT